MSIAIVIPAYNGENLLADTLDSVIAQTDSDWTLIVVNDGSSDRTMQVATEYAKGDRRIVVVNQENGRVAVARNKGFSLIDDEARYVMFLDQDDLLEVGALSELRRALDANPAYPAAHGMARRVERRTEPAELSAGVIQNEVRRSILNDRVTIAEPDEPTTRTMIVYDNLICTPGAALIRRSVLNELASRDGLLFDPSDVPLDDWGFWLRLSSFGDLLFVPKIVLNWRRHSFAGSTDSDAMRHAEMRLRRKMLSDIEAGSNLHHIAFERYSRLCRTDLRRSARASFRQTMKRLSAGNVAGACSAAFAGVGQYSRYLFSKAKP